MAKLILVADDGTLLADWQVAQVTYDQLEDLNFDQPEITVMEDGSVEIDTETIIREIQYRNEQGKIGKAE